MDSQPTKITLVDMSNKIVPLQDQSIIVKRNVNTVGLPSVNEKKYPFKCQKCGCTDYKL